MSLTTPPIKVGTASANAVHAADLGKVYWQNGKAYRVVQMLGALAAAAKKILVSALDATTKEKTFVVTTSTTANDHTVAGIVPAGQTGSTGTTGLVAGDYFMLQVSGPAEVISAAAIAAGGLIGTSTTAGKADDATVAAGVGACGVAMESAAGADESVGIDIKGLI